ncbi:DNA polymerase III subunit gamma/tau [Dasania sp. GY-MA-18]|uniref:DNA polymerase III subunit gamma/tau n=1 Tax=Dasania phycosphaerae TaxID=2950436 RepID=A0A9J6RI75_9GAMM|nr:MULTISPECIES: DNA polymerase III subunit gamma/tau [Dasania]MCR8921735.1 DNA polymerase III subunit gamma/tau [Dasania sp. GY-MA-18]MCZ0864163.1 DNA polymerase III subunit gamma/tau [Dasania phycosphaerae]MCZ0867891.1 DNA polymerase III subunit gamma/tau [Dasania phycosphaerae]
MSYQVLARKWRPKTFREMVGQEHVLKALINALDHNRLHHAYLFTGTRGVGKTTIARILAKCLNCEVGVSSVPCGQCSACNEINEGRFVDLIEVDAASRTKVEDTRELLENVQYAPTAGRYKVYLIDEVHMLSNSSFNALLKTLEEPPPHVKFLLATTDPQKLPATVLSRCLQFNLKNMSPERIVGHLQNVLQQELVEFEEPALWQLGRAADGSMRDALSLTDQAIAFGSGSLSETDVRQMLGTIDQHFVVDVLRGLMAHDGAQVLASVDKLSQFAPDYSGALEEMLTLLHRIAIAQVVPDAIDNSYGDAELIGELARAITGEDAQLFYQMALVGRRDLSLSPDPRSGFEMLMLRMLAFKPAGVPQVGDIQLQNSPVAAAQPAASAAPAPAMEQVSPAAPAQAASPQADPAPQANSAAQAAMAAQGQPQQGMAPQANQAAAPNLQPQAAPQSPPPAPAQQAAAPQQPAQVQPQAEAQPEAAEPVKKPETAGLAAAKASLTSPAAAAPSPELPVVGEAEVAVEVEAPEAESQQRPVNMALAAAKAELLNPAAKAASPVANPAASPEPAPELSVVDANPTPAAPTANTDEQQPLRIEDINVSNWPALYPRLGFGGVVGNIAAHCALVERNGEQLSFVLDENNASLYNEGYADRMQQHLTVTLNCPVKVSVMVTQVAGETPASYSHKCRNEQKQQATRALQNDPNVRLLVEDFGASLDLDSVSAVH